MLFLLINHKNIPRLIWPLERIADSTINKIDELLPLGSGPINILDVVRP
jgi:hypothetical protein